MKDRPILMSAPMVRAILEGRKTQTRRVIPDDWWRCLIPDDVVSDPAEHARVCALGPYGLPGDRLWVREAWRPFWDGTDREGAIGDCIQYRADMAKIKPEGLDEETGHRFSDMCDPDDPDPRWRPSIYMPRWACRLTLEVVSVRVERLQEISEADAIAEGVQTHAQFYAAEYKNDGTKPPETIQGSVPWYRYDGEACAATSARHSFQTLWESINGPGSWALNPWVWVVEFKRVEVPNG